ncbi:phosphotransferase enzyme family protein [Paenibacillus sp. GCM10027626]|uniref:phosphotransferase enzyme family protein n=1 Tax=Paenibacillus sp. GCM10027626 TaxID=3273411 RepID=UPI00363DD6F4
MNEQWVRPLLRERLGCQPSSLNLIGGYHNNVYELSADEAIIIKVYNRMDTAAALVLAELEWTAYLHAHGVNTAEPLMLNHEAYIHPLDDQLYFTAYKKIHGTPVDSQDQTIWNSRLFVKWGEGLGKMHALASAYQGKVPRMAWSDHPLYQFRHSHLDELIQEKWVKYCRELERMDKTKETYGLIHGDLHHHNFIVGSGGELIFIDFGDCEYHWFAYDIAIAVYHAALTVKDSNNRTAFARSFFSAFMEGYAKHRAVESCMSQIDFFINFRQLYSYVYHMHYLDQRTRTEQQSRALEELRHALLKEDSFLGSLQ